MLAAQGHLRLALPQFNSFDNLTIQWTAQELFGENKTCNKLQKDFNQVGFYILKGFNWKNLQEQSQVLAKRSTTDKRVQENRRKSPDPDRQRKVSKKRIRAPQGRIVAGQSDN